MSIFRKATRRQSKLRLAITGPSGSGKTYSALAVASGIGGRIAVVDTEHGSASLYADRFAFDVLEMSPPFSPERFIEAIQAAANDYDVMIIDSITHEWMGEGGILNIHDKIVRSSKSGNSYTAWAEVTPRHNKLLDAILRAPIHIIATLRSKTEYVLQDVGGKTVPRKVGMAPVQRDGFEYEFTTVLDLSLDRHLASVSKDRTGLFDGRDPAPLSAETGRMLVEWLSSGAPDFDLDAELARIARATSMDDLMAIWNNAPADQRHALKDALSQRKTELTTTKETTA
ncbi:MAG: ATP-binding protein [Rhodocyclaceae bacterium]|nr:ATP-binding protein [Rhodocyclaceae bacterium]